MQTKNNKEKKKKKKGKEERKKKKEKKKKGGRKKKKKKWDIGGVEGCGKVEGKGGIGRWRRASVGMVGD